jgi:hypothetical protein
MPNDDWMKKTGGGKRESAYTDKAPVREPIRKPGRGNVAEVIRDKNRRTRKQSGA